MVYGNFLGSQKKIKVPTLGLKKHITVPTSPVVQEYIYIYIYIYIYKYKYIYIYSYFYRSGQNHKMGQAKAHGHKDSSINCATHVPDNQSEFAIQLLLVYFGNER